MKTHACVLYKQEDIRIEDLEIGEVGPHQALVRVGAGGLCGSDIHYYWHGGIGTSIRVTEPIVPGHEIAGTVEAVGEAVTNVKPGDRVAVNPSKPCMKCKFCQMGLHQHCLDMYFFGSAMRKPHTHGGFRQHLIAEDFQCVPVGNKVSLAEAASTEPLAVALHAINQAGNLFGKRILVTGAGPIGALLIGAARLAGAQEIVALDISEAPLKAAAAMGADVVINPNKNASQLMDEYSKDKGYFDAAFECTGAGQVLNQIFPVVAPRGAVVMVGISGETPIPTGTIVGKEIALIGTHRFHREYEHAAQLIKEQRINVFPTITTTLPMERIVEAYEIARDRSAQMKVQLTFD